MRRIFLRSHACNRWRLAIAQPFQSVRPASSRSSTPLLAPVSRGPWTALVENTHRGGWVCSAAAQAPPGMTVLAEAVIQLQGGAVTARLDQQLLELFPTHIPSATAAKRAIRRLDVLLNGERCSTSSAVTSGDTVQLLTRLGGGRQWEDTSQKPSLPRAYEDDHMAIVIKPQGLPTQGKGEASVQGRVKYCLQPTPLPGALFRPHHAHRLDAPTGGLLLVAKTRTALASLCTALTEHRVAKRYEALLIGRLEGCGMINSPVDDKPAVTLFQVVSHHPSTTFGTLTWVSLWPKTGRRHQLRKHMAYMGAPIVGDMKYKHHRRQEFTWEQLASVEDYVPKPSQEAATAGAAEAAMAAQQDGVSTTSQVVPLAAAVSSGAAAQPENQTCAVQQQQQQQQQQQGGLQRGGWRAQSDSATQQPPASASQRATSRRSSSAQQTGSDSAGSEQEPEVDVEGSSSSNSRSSSQVGEVLRDGQVVPLCLWAVQLRLMHPITGQQMDVSVGAEAAEVYQQVLQREVPAPGP